MKANYSIVNRGQQKKIAKQAAVEEIKNQMKTVCPGCTLNMQYQIMATMLWVMHTQFGYGTARLNRLKDAIEREFDLMEKGILGRDYKASMLYQSLKEMGVDMETSCLDGEGNT